MMYEPAEDSVLLAQCVKKYARGRVLDVGCGSGFATEGVDNVVGVDKNPEAVAYCKTVQEGTFLVSDMFAKVRGKFVTVVCNPPYLPSDPRAKDMALDGGKRGNEWILRFCKGVGEVLTTDGQVLLLYSSLSHPEEIHAWLEKNLWEWEVVQRKKLFMESLYVVRMKKRQIRLSIEEKVRKLEYAAEGRRSWVFRGTYRGKDVAVKVKKPGNAKNNEARMLRLVNKQGIGPKFLYATDAFVVMEWITGAPFVLNTKHAVSLVKQAKRLDELGVQKEEMHRLNSNVLVRNSQVVLLDFERARFVERPQNVTQLCSYLAVHYGKDVREWAKAYKGNYRTSVTRLIRMITREPTKFEKQVYAVTKQIPMGKVATYAQVAQRMGCKAYRAVGQALNKNPFAPQVPCHRVVASDRTLGGFASGVSNKRKLLQQEGVEIVAGKVSASCLVKWKR